MARGPIVTQELYDHVKEIMDEVPQKEKESLDNYAKRLNEKYNQKRPLSPDTYSRIRKTSTLEEYREIIRKKHPKNVQKEEQLHMVEIESESSISEAVSVLKECVEVFYKMMEEDLDDIMRRVERLERFREVG